MNSKSIRVVLIPSILVLLTVWVLSKPLAGLGLLFYNSTGKYFSYLQTSVIHTQQGASDLLTATEKLQILTKENRLLKLKNSKLAARSNKIEHLLNLLSFKESFNYETIAAEIIGRSPDTWHKQIIINKGSAEGVQVGKGVLTENGIVGQIIKVSQHSSIVQLIFDRNFKIGAKVKRNNRYTVLQGNHPAPASLSFLTIDSDIEEGDEIVSSGINLNAAAPSYPEDYPLAKVVEVRKDPNIVDLLVKVKIHEDLTSIKEVFILR